MNVVDACCAIGAHERSVPRSSRVSTKAGAPALQMRRLAASRSPFELSRIAGQWRMAQTGVGPCSTVLLRIAVPDMHVAIRHLLRGRS